MNLDDLESVKKCREIKKEILNFGVSQSEIINLIRLLSLELENRDLMLKISEICNLQCIDDSNNSCNKLIIE